MAYQEMKIRPDFFQLPLDKISMEGLKELKQAVIWLKNQF